MADEPTNQNPTPGDASAPEPKPVEGQPATPPATPNVTKMAEELGTLKAQNKILQDYKDQMDPVLTSLYSDEELLKKATEVHNKRLGITPESAGTPAETTVPSVPSAMEIENRNAHIKTIVDKFSIDHGIDKLDAETQQGLNTKIGVILQDMLDPKGNKTLPQIMDDVSLNKLPTFLDNAYYLATKNETIEAAKNQGKQEAATQNLGIIGSMPSQSPNPENVFLTAQDRNTAKMMGVSEEKWLEAKKQIEKNKGQIYQGA